MRNFPDFIDAYLEYARDNFCPDHFHKWIGISIMAACLERKVSADQGPIRHFPNLYVMLVSHPGVGKSTAINRGVDLIYAIKKDHGGKVRFIPKQITDAAFLHEMRIVDYFPVGGGTIHAPQSAGFFYADEASASALQDVCGSFTATMTAMYDCPPFYDKATLGGGSINIENPCMNMLAGSTFNYLKELVNERSVMGGFASRLIYVVAKERKIRNVKWNFKDKKDYDTRAKLIDDLLQIHQLTGPFKISEDFIEKYEDWQPKFDAELIALNSEKMESIMARKGTNLIKLAMLCSVSESNDMIIEGRHFDRAKEFMDQVTLDNALIISKAIMEQRDTQIGVNEAIKTFIGEADGKIPIEVLRRKIVEFAVDLTLFEKTYSSMLATGILVIQNGLVSYGDSPKKTEESPEA